jgi:hypothetical protein
MRRSHMPALLAMMTLLAAGCARSESGSARPHESLSSIEPLRAAFNADSGKVRAIFLASPT